MQYSVLFAPAAKQDFREIYDYYENIMPGLGDRFDLATDERLERLAYNTTCRRTTL